MRLSILIVLNILMPRNLEGSITDQLESLLGNGYSVNPTTYESYQGQMKCTSIFPPIQPQTLNDIQEIVYFALKYNFHVKPFGSKHSVTDCICTDGIPLDMKLIRHVLYDPVTGVATVGAGIEIQDMMESLNYLNRGITGSPIFGGITLGGAIGVGAHGSYLKGAATFSDQVVSITFVDGLGQIRRLTMEEDEEMLKAFRVNLGLLGIIYEIGLVTRPQYKFSMSQLPVDETILFENGGLGIIQLAQTYDRFQFYWFPSSQQVVLSLGTEVPVTSYGNCETHLVPDCTIPGTCEAIILNLELLQDLGDYLGLCLIEELSKVSLYEEVPVFKTPPIFTKSDGITFCPPTPSPAVGFSHRMMTNRCPKSKCWWEHGLLIEDMSFAIELGKLPQALIVMKEIITKELAAFPLAGILFRFLSPSDSYLGLSSGYEPMVDIEMVAASRLDRTKPKLGLETYQAIEEALVYPFGGRPHWGKNGPIYFNPALIQRNFPHLPQFIQVMNEMDPFEIFMNDMGRRIKYGVERYTLTDEQTERCGVNDACFCEYNSQCGENNGGLFDYVCGSLFGFPVCMQNPNIVNELRESVSKTALKLTPAVNTVTNVVTSAVPVSNNQLLKRVTNKVPLLSLLTKGGNY